MKQFVLTYLLTLIVCTIFGQHNDTWTAFWNKDTTLVGFKDKKGIVKIEPKFSGFTSANKFDNIIAVSEELNDTYKSYYLTKTGKIVGKDSLHIFDNGVDCESEGFIRFRDKKTDKAGMFNSRGDMAIPAEYDDLTRVTNGMIIALKGAKKKFWDEDDHSGCNHFSWTGGKELLLDTNNKVLVDNFKHENNLNFFSLLKSLKPNQDTTRQNFLGTDGQYYSFVDFEKEFRKWLTVALLDNFSKNNLLTASFKQVIYWKEPNGWINASKEDFIDANFELIKSKLAELKAPNCSYSIFSEGLNQFMFDSEDYTEYYNNCGESKDWIFPVKNIVITHKEKNDFSQDHFEFLRTNEGYRLISVTIRKGELK